MITLTPKEKKVFESMIALGCSEEEAFEVIESDRRIDKGEKIFDLDPELEKGAKKARQAHEKQIQPQPRGNEKRISTKEN